MKTLIHVAMFSILTVFAACVASAQSKTQVRLPETNPFTDMLPADYCEIVSHPQQYDGKLIRLRVIWYQALEWATVYSYDSSCGQGMRPEFDCPNEAACAELRDQIWRTLGPHPINTAAAMVLKGRIRHRRFITSNEMRLGRGMFDFHIVAFEDRLQLPMRPNDKGWPPEFLLKSR